MDKQGRMDGIPWELLKALHDLHPKPLDALTSQAPLTIAAPATANAATGADAIVESDRRYVPSPLVYLPTIPLDSFQNPGALDHLASTLSQRLVFDAINIGSMLGTTMSAANAAISAAMISSLLDAGKCGTYVHTVCTYVPILVGADTNAMVCTFLHFTAL
jgi:hypothetical protein